MPSRDDGSPIDTCGCRLTWATGRSTVFKFFAVVLIISICSGVGASSVHSLTSARSALKLSFVPKSSILRPALLSLRCGAAQPFDDEDIEDDYHDDPFEEDDDEKDEEFDEEMAEEASRRSPRSRQRSPPPRHPGRDRSARYDHRLAGPPPSSSRPGHEADRRSGYINRGHSLDGRQTPPSVKRPKGGKKRSSHWTQRLARQSMQVTGQVAWNTVRQSGKIAYQLVRPKRVELKEIGGLWRLDQQVVLSNGKKGSVGKTLASVATVELDPRRRLVLIKEATSPLSKEQSADGDEEEVVVTKEPFTFVKNRFGSFQTEFVGRVFMVGERKYLYGYRGTWQRKMADSNVIKLVGKIYIVRQQRFGKERGKYLFGKAVGTFVARRRIQMDEDDEDDEYDDEYGYEDGDFEEAELDDGQDSDEADFEEDDIMEDAYDQEFDGE